MDPEKNKFFQKKQNPTDRSFSFDQSKLICIKQNGFIIKKKIINNYIFECITDG